MASDREELEADIPRPAGSSGSSAVGSGFAGGEVGGARALSEAECTDAEEEGLYVRPEDD